MGVISGQNYYLVVNGYEWTTARTNAQNLGGDLVVIDDATENNFIVANFRSEISIDDWTGGARGGAWIGLNQNTERSDREWVDGTAISYTNYGQGGGQDKLSIEPIYNTDYEEDPFEYDNLAGFVPSDAVGY